MNPLELTGRTRSHIVSVAEPPCAVHEHVLAPLENLRRAALGAGLDLKVVSSFRDFDRQLAIWNGKFYGTRPLLDALGRPLDAASLAPAERVEAILCWSALPGASRHHWGTDLDLVDGIPVAAGHAAQLTPEEFAPGGPFARMAQWLELHAARFGFFRPYRGRLSGVQAEPWHVSYAPVADGARRALSVPVLRAALEAAPLAGKDYVLQNLEILHARFVAGIDWP